MEKAKNQKKRTALVAAVLCLALAAGLGTYAWLTATDTATNTFTVGSINNPDHNPGTDDPTKPDPDSQKPDGNLTETKWVADSKLTPGATIAKNPNVGIGANSEDSYVFVYVKNALVKDDTADANTPYFKIDSTNWAAVSGTNEAWVAKNNGNESEYVSGLFMYKKGQLNTGEPGLLTSSKGENATDVYTGELFSSVVVPGTLESSMINATDGKANMTVSCYIFGGNQKDGNTDAAANALAQAKAWATEQAK